MFPLREQYTHCLLEWKAILCLIVKSWEVLTFLECLEFTETDLIKFHFHSFRSPWQPNPKAHPEQRQNHPPEGKDNTQDRNGVMIISSQHTIANRYDYDYHDDYDNHIGNEADDDGDKSTWMIAIVWWTASPSTCLDSPSSAACGWSPSWWLMLAILMYVLSMTLKMLFFVCLLSPLHKTI